MRGRPTLPIEKRRRTISVNLPPDLIELLDRVAKTGSHGEWSRSRVIERALRLITKDAPSQGAVATTGAAIPD